MESGLSPLEFMLQKMRDPGTASHEPLDAAKAAAPHVHPRLANVAMTTKSLDEIVTATS